MIEALSTVNPTCLLRLWNKFIPQIQDAMNILRTSQQNSRISTYEKMEGAFDWNRTPFTPLGCKAVVYQAPEEQISWAPHAHNAFYVGRTPLHYRLKRYWMANTQGFTHAVGKLYPAHCPTRSIFEADLTASQQPILSNPCQC